MILQNDFYQRRSDLRFATRFAFRAPAIKVGILVPIALAVSAGQISNFLEAGIGLPSRRK